MGRLVDDVLGVVFALGASRADGAVVDDALGAVFALGASRADGAVVDDEHRVGCTLTRNDLEEAFLRLARAARHPPDAVNHWIAFPDGGGTEADFLYREKRLIAEADGRDPHTIRKAFNSDRRRDQRLMLLGWRVVRFTWQQITSRPTESPPHSEDCWPKAAATHRAHGQRPRCRHAASPAPTSIAIATMYRPSSTTASSRNSCTGASPAAART
jgi:hypothetical protein